MSGNGTTHSTNIECCGDQGLLVPQPEITPYGIFVINASNVDKTSLLVSKGDIQRE
jgi:hypothetical protein